MDSKDNDDRVKVFWWIQGMLILACLIALPATAATISGQVTDTSGNPIENVCVNAYTGPCWTGSSFGNVTDAKGNYSIEVDDGTYYITTDVSCGGFQSSFFVDEGYDNISGGDDCNQMSAVAAGSTDINFALEPGGSISGTLISGGSPITGQNSLGVTVFSGNCDNLIWAGYGSINSSDGTYRTGGIPAGTYILQAETFDTDYIREYWADPASVRDCTLAETISVTEGQAVTDRDFQLEIGGSITGTLFESDGTTPIDGNADPVEIWVESGTDPCNTQWVTSGFVNPDGTYTISGVAEGTYYLITSPFNSNYISELWASPASVRTCSQAQAITVTAGNITTDKNFQLELGASVSGTLYESDGTTPIDGGIYPVEVLLETGTNPCYTDGYMATTINPDGTYEFIGVTSGTYYLTISEASPAYIQEYWATPASVRNCSQAQTVTVTAGQDYGGKDFQLETGGSISGTLFESDGTTPITGTDIWIDAYSGTDPCDLSYIKGVTVNQDGTYTIPGLEAGSYYLQIWPDSTNYLGEYWADPASVIDCAEADPVDLAAGETVDQVNFQLNEGIRIEGTVYDSNGITPLSGSLMVAVFSGDCASGLNYETSAGIDQDGNYHIIVSEPGEYYLKADTLYGSGANYIPEYWADPASVRECSSAQKLTLEAGSTYSEKNFQLDEGGSISGTVFQANGTDPLTGVNTCIDVYRNDPCDNTWDRAGGSCTTDGTYTIGGLASGTYYLYTNVDDNSNYVNEWWADPASNWQCGNAQPVTVTAGETTPDIDFQLAEGGSISGTLYDDTTGQPISGQSGMRIKIYGGNSACDDNYLGDEDVDDKGKYTITQVPDGSFYLKTETGNSYVDEWLNSSGGDPLCDGAQSVTISGGNDIPGQDFSLALGYTISGHVYEADGKTPIDNLGRSLRVQVFQGDCDSLTWFASTGVSDTDGSFQTPAVPDGTYYLRFKEAGDDASDDLHQREWWADPLSVSFCPQAEAIEISGNDITGKDFQINLKKKFPWNLVLSSILARRK